MQCLVVDLYKNKVILMLTRICPK